MTDQTGDVLADIDAALEGWHGTDPISRDAMRWAPKEPDPPDGVTTQAARAARVAQLGITIGQMQVLLGRRFAVVARNADYAVIRRTERLPRRWPLRSRWVVVLMELRGHEGYTSGAELFRCPWPGPDPLAGHPVV